MAIHPVRSFFLGGRLAWGSVATVTIGTTAKLSRFLDSKHKVLLEWTGLLTADVTVSGVGGLDTGAEGSSRFYACFVIGDMTGTNSPAALLSENETPTLPTGYDVYRRLGWVKNDSGSDFLKFTQHGSGADREIWYDAPSNSMEILTNVGSTSFASVSFSPFVPPTSRLALTRASFKPSSGANAASFRAVGSGHSSTDAPWRISGGGPSGAYARSMQNFPLDASQNLEWRTSSSGDRLYLMVNGYRDEL